VSSHVAGSHEANSYDIAIIGAGIGGACAALCLARRGARVLLLEAGHFPRHKVCGEFLSPESRAVFQRAGVLPAISCAGAKPVLKARVVTSLGNGLDTHFPAPGLSISRFALDEILWRAAREAGVLCVEKARVKKLRFHGESFSIETSEAVYQAKMAIDATGRARLSSHASTIESTPELESAPRFLGLKAHFKNVGIEPGLVELHFWRDGYCGLVGIENGAYNVCLLARYDARDAKNNAPEKVWARVLRQCPALRERLQNATRIIEWQTTANVQFAARAPVSQSEVLRVGDAAGYIHPLTGDGMAMAARSGELAAAVCAARLRGSLSTRDATTLYEKAWRREFAARLQAGDALGKLLLAPFLPPAFVGATVGVLARWPQASQMLVRVTRGRIL
jgi:flavin-dependent dehydrogenase